MTTLSVRAHGGAIALMYTHRLGAALLVAYPLSKIVGATGIARLPGGDLALFAPGGTYLLEALRVGATYVAATSVAFTLVGAALTVLGVIPLAALAVALDAQRPLPRAEWAARTLAALPAFVFLGGVTVLAQALTLLLGAAAASGARDALLGATERSADLAAVSVAAAALVVVAILGIVEDLARAEVAHRRAKGTRAIGPALSTLLSHPGATLAAWTSRAAVALLVVLGAAWATGVIGVHRPGAWRVAGVWLVHQGAIVALVLLRASWMGRALALSDVSLPQPQPPAPDDRAERTAAPADPSSDPAA